MSDVKSWFDPQDIAELLEMLAAAADRCETNYSETAHIARHAAFTVWGLMQACGYPVPADKEIIKNPFRCGICDAENLRKMALKSQNTNEINNG